MSSDARSRIVSLLASGTELVCALDAGDRLVGRSHECDYPEWVKRLPQVSRPTFDITGPSLEIDRRVRQILAERRPLYQVDEALLAKLAPDILITQTHCEVCAVSPGNLAHGKSPELARQAVVALSSGTLSGILQGFLEVARVLGLSSAGDALVSGIHARQSTLRQMTQDLARPRVICLEWIEPIFVMGNWGPELVTLAGGEDALGSPGARSRDAVWDEVRRADPEVLVVAPCGFGIERTLGEMDRLAGRSGWGALRAVKNRRVFVADGNLYFNRSGPSVFESSEILAEILHPNRFAPRHQGTAWRRWEAS